MARALDPIRDAWPDLLRDRCRDAGCELLIPPSSAEWLPGRCDQELLSAEGLHEQFLDPRDRSPDAGKAADGIVFLAFTFGPALAVVVELKSGTYDSKDVRAKFENTRADIKHVARRTGIAPQTRFLLLAGGRDTGQASATSKKRTMRFSRASGAYWLTRRCGFSLGDLPLADLLPK